ncbi:MAG: hypothetical protein HY094_02310 [Candidatus Melainabacteria bacterium]|nr:hypothetical protein [Candidatus Melainabacteria bacterium]
MRVSNNLNPNQAHINQIVSPTSLISPENTQTLAELITSYKQSQFKTSFATTKMRTEAELVKKLFSIYRSNITILGGVTHQATEIYSLLLANKASLYGISKIQYDKEESLLEGQVYYDYFLNEALRFPSAKRTSKGRTSRQISESSMRPLQILQEQVLPKALENVSKVFKELIFTTEAEFMYEKLSTVTELVAGKNRISKEVIEYLRELGKPCVDIYDYYIKNLQSKKFDELFIDRKEETLLRPIYGYLHRLSLIIQSGSFGFDYKHLLHNDPEFNPYHVPRRLIQSV